MSAAGKIISSLMLKSLSDIRLTGSLDDTLIFRGLSSEEAENFIRQVNILAFNANRTRDTRWTAEFAATAFAGDALRKFRKLSSEVRNDWDKLQEALLNEYSPASAPPGAAAAPPAYG
ncbi:hypothetical protein FRC00_003870, partial [Tulasnella sp. 408]